MVKNVSSVLACVALLGLFANTQVAPAQQQDFDTYRLYDEFFSRVDTVGRMHDLAESQGIDKLHKSGNIIQNQIGLTDEEYEAVRSASTECRGQLHANRAETKNAFDSFRTAHPNEPYPKGLLQQRDQAEKQRQKLVFDQVARLKAAVAKETPVIFADPQDEAIEEDGETEFLVESLSGPGHDGWFPKGELSIIGAASGVGKTSWAMPLLEKIRHGQEVWGHKVSKPRDYRVLLHDRSKKAMRRTARALHMGDEAMQRIIRLSTDQQKGDPAAILQAAINECPGG